MNVVWDTGCETLPATLAGTAAVTKYGILTRSTDFTVVAARRGFRSDFDILLLRVTKSPLRSCPHITGSWARDQGLLLAKDASSTHAGIRSAQRSFHGPIGDPISALIQALRNHKFNPGSIKYRHFYCGMMRHVD